MHHEQYAVSRATIREAVRGLVEEDTSHGARDRAASSPPDRSAIRSTRTSYTSYLNRRAFAPVGGSWASRPSRPPRRWRSGSTWSPADGHRAATRAPPTTDPPSSPTDHLPATSSMRNAIAKRSAAPSTPAGGTRPSRPPRRGRRRASERGSGARRGPGGRARTLLQHLSRSTSTAPAVGSCIAGVARTRRHRASVSLTGSRHRGGALALVAGRTTRRPAGCRLP